MIIRSWSRKSASFYQLYHYINGDDRVPYFISWNLNVAHHLDEGRILDQFYENSEILKARKNGNVLYHEIISITRQPEVPLDRQMKALHDVSLKYIQDRGPNLLAYGRMHMKDNDLHVHVMYSANEVDHTRPFYLSTAEYEEIQKRCERYIRQTYPDLKQPVIYDKERTPSPIKSRQREYEYTKRTGQKTKKQQVKEKLTELLSQERSQSLKSLLKQHGFELYQRGKHHGVWYDGRKYRLATLGLLEEFVAAKGRRNAPRPEPNPTNFKEEKRAEKEESQQTPPQPERQSTQATGTTMDAILEGIYRAEINKQAELFEKLLNQKDLMREYFPDLEYTVRRNGNCVEIDAFGSTLVREFNEGPLWDIPLEDLKEKAPQIREEAIQYELDQLVEELADRSIDQRYRDAEAAREKNSDIPEL